MNSPDANELLTVASETLLSRILPAVPKDLEYDVRMIARAMAISSRECGKGRSIEEAEYDVLSGLVNRKHGCLDAAEMRKSLSQAIRSGLYDEHGPNRNALLEALRAITKGELELCNPKLVDCKKGPG
ncbi:DUF6285 domain-containing protein [Marinobacter sp. 71-i]|uniref:DUF6285 domain-containing protein n=1 Tax=Marinobacter iranensis TaxID=2962607 RepID=A0ABT5YAI2_9GAMM|nr:DUF6285 domain-containing protein [Marinobacter iranensis]MDF0750100.1 DUF6285 domain-containing protein [Marinobacter iranensis]